MLVRNGPTALNRSIGAVLQMDQATRQESSMVEQATEAAVLLRDRATHLARPIGAFRLERA